MSSDREWDTLVAMIGTARRAGRRARRDLDRYYDRRDEVDFPQVVDYTSVLLHECLRRPNGELPTETELRQLARWLYPAWHRTARDQPHETLLNILLVAFGYQRLPAGMSGLTACTYLVIAIAAALPADADVDAMRTTVYQTNELYRQLRAERDESREPDTGSRDG